MLHLRVFGDVAFHQIHVFAHGFELGISQIRNLRRFILRPTDKHCIRVLERRSLRRRSDAILNLHEKHVAHNAQALSRNLEIEFGIVEINIRP